jgi:hypothetical protein
MWRRFYKKDAQRPLDIKLLYFKRFTIEGARKKLKEISRLSVFDPFDLHKNQVLRWSDPGPGRELRLESFQLVNNVPLTGSQRLAPRDCALCYRRLDRAAG